MVNIVIEKKINVLKIMIVIKNEIRIGDFVFYHLV